MEKKHVLQSVHAELIATKLNEFYGDYGKFSNHDGNVRMESMSRIEPFLFSEISCFAAGYKLSLDELATLEALLKEAGEKLAEYEETVNDIYVHGYDPEIHNLGVSIPELRKKIQKTLGGEA